MPTLEPLNREELVAELRRRTSTPDFHFLSTEHLSELSEIRSPDSRILSLFLPLTPEERVGGGWQTILNNLSRQVLNGHSNGGTLKKDLKRIEESLGHGLPRTGRGVVFYANSDEGVYRKYGLSIETPALAVVETRPHVRPLARLRDEHDRFGIILFSQKGLRFFFSQIGLVEEVFDLVGGDILTSDYASKDARQNKQAELRKNLVKRAAQAVEILADELNVRHLIYSTSVDLETPFLDALNQKTRNKISGSFSCDANASPPEIADVAEPVQRAVEEREERETIRQATELLTSRAVVGIEAVVDALNQQRVRTLIMDDRLRLPGSIDRNTNTLSARTDGEHEIGESDVRVKDDLFELMVERALVQNAEIEFVRSEGGLEDLEKLGQCAAILRF